MSCIFAWRVVFHETDTLVAKNAILLHTFFFVSSMLRLSIAGGKARKERATKPAAFRVHYQPVAPTCQVCSSFCLRHSLPHRFTSPSLSPLFVFFLNSKCLQLVPYNLEIIRSFLSSSCLFFLNKCCPWNNIVQVKRKILIVLLFVLGFFFWFHFLSLKTTLSGAAFYNETGENQFDDHYSESCPSWNEKMYQSNVKPFSPLGTQREKNNRTLNIIKNYLTPPPPLLCKKREETRRGMLKGRVRKFYKRKDSQNCLPTCKGKKRIKKGDVAHQPD